jgi:hypothetical protein
LYPLDDLLGRHAAQREEQEWFGLQSLHKNVHCGDRMLARLRLAAGAGDEGIVRCLAARL